jgi:hypothetical protein
VAVNYRWSGLVLFTALWMNFGCQSQVSTEMSNFDDIYSLPGTDRDIPENMKSVSTADLGKEGILKCDGFDAKKKYVYARFEVKGEKVEISYVGSISGKYQLFHEEFEDAKYQSKIDLDHQQGSIQWLVKDSNKPFLELSFKKQNAQSGSQKFPAKLTYENLKKEVNYQKLDLKCIAFRHKGQ